MRDNAGVRSLQRSGLVLIVLVGFTIALAAPRATTVYAGDDDGCDPNEPIACLTAPEEEAEPGAARGAPAAAAPAPPRPCPPILGPASPNGAAAAPAPVPPGCPAKGVVAAVNRANVLYRQALFRLDGSGLTAAWGGEALADLLGQIAALRAGDRYGDPQLLAINLVEMNANPATARVRTFEHWIYRERARFSGQLLVEQDEWVENVYELRFRGAWIVMRDIITVIDAPALPPPPRPFVSARLTTDRDLYLPGETIQATITNDGSVTLWAGGGPYPCGPITVERLTADGGWEPVPAPTFVACLAIAQAFPPGQSSVHSIPAAAPGIFRLVFRYSADGAPGGVAYSAPYLVR
jgi:hypothetical protein